MKVILLSGDGHETTEAAAGLLGITDFFGQKMPHEKAAIVHELKEQGHRVAVVGDGVNDAGALAGADVAFAMGTGNDIAKEASDLVIPSANLASVGEAFHLSALWLRTTRQNLTFAFLYNALAVPVAASGLLNPIIAVTAMFMSSLMVTGNTLRVMRRQR
jgi:P-type Cu+ transporter